MSEEIQQIDRLIKQSAELSNSLIRLARKIQEQNTSKTQLNQEQVEDLRALHAKLTDLRSQIDVVKREILTHRYDHIYASPQEAAIHVLSARVTDKTMTPEQSVTELTSLLRTDLPASRKIEICQTAKASLEAGDDIAGKLRPFLKNAPDQAERQRKVNKRVFNNAFGQRM